MSRRYIYRLGELIRGSEFGDIAPFEIASNLSRCGHTG